MRYILLLLFFTASLPGMSAQVDTVAEELHGTTLSLKIPVTPAAIAASDGAFEFYVKINWTRSKGAKCYHLYRSTKAGEKGKQLITMPGGQRANWAGDYQVEPGVLYYYQVEAEDNNGKRSDRSTEDSGFIPKPPAIATPLPRASDNPNSAEASVLLAWTPSAGALRYEFEIAPVHSAWTTTEGFNTSAVLLHRVIRSTQTRLPWTYFATDSIAWTVRSVGSGGRYLFCEPRVLVNPGSGLLGQSAGSESLPFRLRNGKYQPGGQRLSFTLESLDGGGDAGDITFALFGAESAEWQPGSVLLQHSPAAVGSGELSLRLQSEEDLRQYRYLLIVPFRAGTLWVERTLAVKLPR
jgi:hypothetical protein